MSQCAGKCNAFVVLLPGASIRVKMSGDAPSPSVIPRHAAFSQDLVTEIMAPS
jgi:hypothetical protein